MAIHYTGKVFRDDSGRFVSKSRGLKSSIARNEFKDYQKLYQWFNRDKSKEIFEEIGKVFKLRPEDREVFKPGIPKIEPIYKPFKKIKLTSKKGKIDLYLEQWNDDYGNEDDYTSGGTRK